MEYTRVKKISYRKFSRQTHKKNWQLKKPSVCRFELTFKCDLHCRHCYSDCYNKPSHIAKELSTAQVKIILDKMHKAGIIWLGFTGGDPLTRRDFPEIYAYAKEKGFIVTVFTNGYRVTEEVVKYFKRQFPFVIELTLNAVSKDSFEKITQVEDSFADVMRGIRLILNAGLPLKIKTLITKDNLQELPAIRKFILGLGLKFRSFYDLYSRLNGDTTPASLRIPPQEVLNISGIKPPPNNGGDSMNCRRTAHAERRTTNTYLFDCAISGGDGIYVDPYGNAVPCNLIRKSAFNLLSVEPDEALNSFFKQIRNRKFTTESKCNGCNLRQMCRWCPGAAYVETHDMEKPIEYYCALTGLIASSQP
jgi:radical SAM protein with 4Fe4S-binding SPASM domain